MLDRTAYRFGDFILTPADRSLRQGTRDIVLPRRAFDLLTVLVASAGQLVTKDRLLQQVWAGACVEENNLQVYVSQLRKLVGRHSIVTVPRFGYRFTLAVEVRHERRRSPAGTASTASPHSHMSANDGSGTANMSPDAART